MTSVQTYEIATEATAFNAPLRNLRLQLDGTTVVVDLIPSVVLNEPTEDYYPDIPGLDKILSNARPIIESRRFMRVHFSSVLAISVQEEFVNIAGVLKFDLGDLPKFFDGRTPYPFLHVVNSWWKSRLPDYQGRDTPDLKHFKILSMETCIDLIGYLEKTEWCNN